MTMGTQIRKPVEIPEVQFLDKFSVPVVSVRCPWPDSAETCGIPQVQFLGQGLHDRLSVSGADGQTEQKTCGDSTGGVLGQVVHARRRCVVPMARQCRKPVEIPQVQFLDKVFTPVHARRCGGPDVQETV